MNTKPKRRLLVENLEQRVVLDGVGLDAAVTPPDWESVIVAMNDDVGDPGAVARDMAAAHGGRVGHTYEHAIKGFSAQLPKAALDALSENPRVKRIEPNLEMHACGQTLPTGVGRIEADSNAVANINGSDERVDVGVAIIDTGIDMDHPDLNVAGGRRFYTISTGPPSQRGHDDYNYDDDNGHGSHVAGIVGALDNDFGVVGVAPGARLYGVKVLEASGSGYLSDIIAGIDWVTENADIIDVANMSLAGQGVSDSYHEAIQNSVAAGVVYVVASGNDYRDILGDDLTFGTSDDTIPAAYPEVATISAIADTDGKPGGEGADTNFIDPALNKGYADDTFADFSNYSNSDNDRISWYDTNNLVTSPGLGIDLMMPGVDIYSTYKDGGYATYSGTSMASPHAAGLAALYIAEHGRDVNGDGAIDQHDVYQIRQALIDGGVPWRSENGLVSLDGDPLGENESNPDSPDKHEENLGWAADQADTTAPAQPNGLTTATGDTLVSLDWDDNTESDLAGYNVYRSTSTGDYSDPVITSVIDSEYTDTGVENGTTYYYVVTAVDTSDNESDYSSEASATPELDNTAPSAPNSFTVNVPTSDGGILNLDWAENAESDLAGYNVYRSTSTGDYSDLVITSVIDSEYTDTGLDNGTTYYYVVTAVDTSDNESDYSSEESGTPIDNLAPDAPGSLAATAGDTEVSLDWTNNTESDLAGYNVYRSTTSGAPYDQIGTSVTDSAYTDTGLENGTTYYYVVTAVDTSDNESDDSGEASATPTDLSTTMHVADLDGSKNIKGRSGKWEAFVTVSIVDSDGGPVANATVSGEWTGAIDASTDGDTASDGTVTFASGDLTGESVTFTVIGVTHGSFEYISDSNVEESLTLSYATTASGSSLESARSDDVSVGGEPVTSLAVSAGDPSSRDPAGGNANRLGTDGPLASEPISQDQVIEASLAVGVGEQAEGQQGGDLYDVLAAEWAVADSQGDDLELTPTKATDLALEEFETWGSALD